MRLRSPRLGLVLRRSGSGFGLGRRVVCLRMFVSGFIRCLSLSDFVYTLMHPFLCTTRVWSVHLLVRMQRKDNVFCGGNNFVVLYAARLSSLF